MKAIPSINDITATVIDSAYKVHTKVGPGLLESAYEAILAKELTKRGLHVERQKPFPIYWEEERLAEEFRVDLLVNDRVIVELKSTETMHPVHPKQLLTYLRLSGLPVGLLLNFGQARMKDGIKRIANDTLSDEDRLR
jgi:iron complex transport system substrate-binding protein